MSASLSAMTPARDKARFVARISFGRFLEAAPTLALTRKEAVSLPADPDSRSASAALIRRSLGPPGAIAPSSDETVLSLERPEPFDHLGIGDRRYRVASLRQETETTECPFGPKRVLSANSCLGPDRTGQSKLSAHDRQTPSCPKPHGSRMSHASAFGLCMKIRTKHEQMSRNNTFPCAGNRVPERKQPMRPPPRSECSHLRLHSLRHTANENARRGGAGRAHF